MSILDTLVTDRTQADVDRVKELAAKGFAGMTAEERAEYLSGMKGAYNAVDLNRVTEAMEYVAERFRGYGYGVKIAPNKIWSMSDIPTPADMEAYLDNLDTLRGALTVLRSTPEVPPDMEGLTWQEANNIESILLDVDGMLTKAAVAFRHCNAAVCGGSGLLIR